MAGVRSSTLDASWDSLPLGRTPGESGLSPGEGGPGGKGFGVPAAGDRSIGFGMVTASGVDRLAAHGCSIRSWLSPR